MTIEMIMGITQNHALGKGGKRVIRTEEDVDRFWKYLKSNSSIEFAIMSAKTRMEIGKKCLPNGRDLVLTRDPQRYVGETRLEGCEFVGLHQVWEILHKSSIEEHNVGKAVVLGGSSIYELFYPYAHKIMLTNFGVFREGDAFFDPNKVHRRKTWFYKNVIDSQEVDTISGELVPVWRGELHNMGAYV